MTKVRNGDAAASGAESLKALPRHIGIIMDGNGRWAKARNLPRTNGHREGLKAAKRVVTAARELGIPCLSLYTFSTENWNRSREEVSFLMDLLSNQLRKELDFYREFQIRVIHSGKLEGLPPRVQDEIREVVADTSSHGGLTVNLAINYGGIDEANRAAQRLLEELAAGAGASSDSADTGAAPASMADIANAVQRRIAGGINLGEYVDHPELPPIDLIIRSGGEQRVSNFFLLQSPYAELYFDEDPWPEWDADHLKRCLSEYGRRQRVFGGDR